MRLIDADEFCRFTDEHCQDGFADLWKELIRRQPTAFDKEKVIEELTLHKKFADYKTQEFDEAGDVQNMEIQDFISLALQGAIRIVEKGGLN